MRKNLTPRTVLVLGIIFTCLIFLLPNILGKEEIKLGPVKMQSINLGLDLKGGMHVILRVMTDKAITDELGLGVRRLEEALEEKSTSPTRAFVKDDSSIFLEFPSPQAMNQAQAYIKEFWSRYSISHGDGNSLLLSLDAEEIKYLKKNALLQAKETIENRIDEFAVKEPQIYTQGTDQIVVRLPGVVDPTRAKSLIGRTAVLEFKIVEDVNKNFAATEKQLLSRSDGKIPDGYGVYPSMGEGRISPGYYLLKKTPDMTGKDLVDARRSVDQMQSPAISFQFNSEAGRRFGLLTQKNIGKPLAIILDNKVMSAPVIQSRITRSGQITGDFTLEDALDLAIVLRAGSLPVPVEIEEERTVGPSLGEDSIRKGYRSFALGGLLVIMFMLVYYRRAGVIATSALVANIVMIMGGLALFGATLTLPGIAGIILTIGMAVDANVIINERIREELRTGKTARAAVEAGYDKALSAILDANVTTAIAGLVLYQFGTGPIRGFAVTLMIGLASSVFSAVIGTRLIYDYGFQRQREVKKLSI